MTEKCGKKKDTLDNVLAPNCFSNLEFNNDTVIMETKSHDKDPANSYTRENIDKQNNSINMKNGNRESNIKISICITENYLQNHIDQQIEFEFE